MEHHRDIIRRAGPDAIRQVTGVSIYTVRSWIHRDSIPGGHWKAIAEAGYASLDELATAAASDRDTSQDAAA